MTTSAVSLVILVLVVQLFSSATLIWQRSGERLDTNREGRIAIDQMRRDLSALLPPEGNGPTLWITRAPGLPDASGHEEIWFLAMLPNSGSSNLCAVGFRLVWDATAHAYLLKRRFLESDEVTAALQGIGEAERMPGTFFTEAAGAEEEILARYVWDLSIRSGSGAIEEPGYPDRSYAEEQPGWVSISFKTLGPAAARRLSTLPIDEATWSDPASDAYRQWIAPHEQHYRTRIPLPGAVGR